MQRQNLLFHDGGDLTSKREGRSCFAYAGKEVFLDINDCCKSKEIECALKRLGTNVHLFFLDNVDVVITDRKEWASHYSDVSRIAAPGVLRNPQADFVDSAGVSHSWEINTDLHGKSRVEEMLKRVKDQPSQVTIDPLDLAARKGITIVSLEEAQQKIEHSAEFSSVKNLTDPFIKVDIAHGNFKPMVKEFPVGLPAVDLTRPGHLFVGTTLPSNEDIQPGVLANSDPSLSRGGEEIVLRTNPKKRQRTAKFNGSNVTCSSSATCYESVTRNKPSENALILATCDSSTNLILNVEADSRQKQGEPPFGDLNSGGTGSKKADSQQTVLNDKDNFTVDTSSPKIQKRCRKLILNEKKNRNASSKRRKHKCNPPHCIVYACKNHFPSKCDLNINFSGKIKISDPLLVPVRPSRTGHIQVFLPDYSSGLRETGEIHIISEGESKPPVPKHTFLFCETSFHVLRDDQFPLQTVDSSYIVTAGTRVHFFNDPATNEVTYKRSWKSFKVPCIAADLIFLSVSPPGILGLEEERKESDILIKITLADYLKVFVDTWDWASLSADHPDTLVPRLNIGEVELLVCFLQWCFNKGHIKKWGKSRSPARRESNISASYNSLSSCFFKVVCSDKSPDFGDFLDGILTKSNCFDKSLYSDVLRIIENPVVCPTFKNALQTKDCPFDFIYPIKTFETKSNRYQRLGYACVEDPELRILEAKCNEDTRRLIEECGLKSVEPSFVDPRNSDEKIQNNCVLKDYPETNYCRDSSYQKNYRTSAGTRHVRQENSSNSRHVLPKKSVDYGIGKDNRTVKPFSDKAGFCEMCKCSYISLRAHEKEEKHCNFRYRPQNFDALDDSISVIRNSSELGKIFDN